MIPTARIRKFDIVNQTADLTTFLLSAIYCPE
jgi:hypothetical protein